jgi:hypothetical protein
LSARFYGHQGGRNCHAYTSRWRTALSFTQEVDRELRQPALSSRPFVLCGLPARRMPKDQLLSERRNGRFILHPDFGVPFGQGRVVPIFLATPRGPAEESDTPRKAGGLMSWTASKME